MSKVNALLEIGCEEIPARFMPGFLADLKAKAEEKLRAERIGFGQVITLGTYRRLTLYIENIAEQQEDLHDEVKGPPVDRAFDAQGKPTQAVIGFAKSQKVSMANIIRKPFGNKEYVFAKISKKGKSTEKVLTEVFPEIIKALYQPLAMRWGELDFKFIRPIHWIVALCGAKIVKFKLAGIASGNKTQGHRYNKLKSENLKVKTVELLSYKKTLLKLGVVVDQEERKKLIKKDVEAVAKKAGAKALIESDLLDEVTYLVEDPIAYVGTINKEFLQIPQDVLITSMKKNQKYFPLLDSKGKLLAKFVVVTDGCKSKTVVEGNEKVLSARLSDAKFFFEEDKKLPLKMRKADLDNVAFFENLGSISAKTERMAKLSAWIGKRLGFDEKTIENAKKISELCKADLTTKMVYEFPVLQGIMGKEYALLSGEDPKVAEGIFEHYLPRFADDKLPQSNEGLTVALADRIDSLVGCFSVGAIPTGSVDPYGLRRAANGIIRIILEKKLDLLLDEAFEHSYKSYEPIFKSSNKPEKGYQLFGKVNGQLIEFVSARLKPILLDKGIRYDVVAAALAQFNDILDTVSKAEVMNGLVAQKWFSGIVVSADRICRIAKNAKPGEVNEQLLVDNEEKALFAEYMQVNWAVGEAVNSENWAKAIKALSGLTPAVEAFFEKVLVMHEDEKLKTNRLTLLKALEKLYLRVADFQQIVLYGVAS
ncbi:MAG: glycine--tRNA ligase subunit beta [Candidatus Margulisbacteria bacterium]|nr:glycine--tRNA ligase subunit beta [Candidatus Margulisiibacteriota bacterium]